MISLSTSTLAALEEMLQNTARSAPADYLAIYLSRGATDEQLIGHLNPEFIPYLQESLQKESIPFIVMGHDKLSIHLTKPRDLSNSLYQLANRMRLGGFIPGWRNEDFAWLDQMVISTFAWSALLFVPLAFAAWQLISTAIPKAIPFG